MNDRFVVGDKIVVDRSPTAEVKISWVGDNVKNWFWKLVEGPAGEPNFRSLTLVMRSYHYEIIQKFGGVIRAITSWGEIHNQMKKQSKGEKGEKGELLTSGAANTFYVPQPVTKIDEKNFSYVDLQGETISEVLANPQYLFELHGQWSVLRAISVRGGGGWDIGAHSVEDPSRGVVGDQVFSRKPK